MLAADAFVDSCMLAADADAWAHHYFFGMKLASLNY
jgi:hypothetical protein